MFKVRTRTAMYCKGAVKLSPRDLFTMATGVGESSVFTVMSLQDGGGKNQLLS